MTAPERILIYRCGALGDTIVSIPAIHAIRERHTGAKFLLMTASGGGGVVWADRVAREFDWFDDVITYTAAEIISLPGLLGIIRRVRSHKIDMVFYLSSGRNSSLKVLRDRLFFLLAGVTRFIPTYSDQVTFWGHLRRSPRLYPQETDRLLTELAQQGITTAAPRFDLPISPQQVAQVSALLKESRLDLTKPLIGLCPGSKQQITRWPEGRYAEVAKRIMEDGGANIAVVGGPYEAQIANSISVAWPKDRWVDMTGLGIMECAELLKRCLFYLGNTTGPMHLAAAVGTRCVAVIPAWQQGRSWYPYGENNTVLIKSVPCQNCYLSECVEQGLRCLKDITVDEVWAACRRMLIYR